MRENSRQKCTKTHMETSAINQAYQRSLFGWGGKNRGSVHTLMDPVHGPGPRRGSMDHGHVFCFPVGDFHVEKKPFLRPAQQFILEVSERRII